MHDIDADALYARVSWRLLPFLFCCYICAYLDRVHVGFAKLQMLDQLNFSETVYGFGAGISFSAISSSRSRATCSCIATARDAPSRAS